MRTLTPPPDSPDRRPVERTRARQALPVTIDIEGLSEGLRRTLGPQPATPGAVGPVGKRPKRTLGAARPIAESPRHRPGVEPLATVVAVLGPQPEPYRSGQVLEALRAGRHVRDIDKALTVLMPRRKARQLITAAKAALAVEKVRP